MFATLILRTQRTSTGFVGLDVIPNSREVLIQLCQRILHEVKEIPPEAVYRQAVEKIANSRLSACLEETDLDKIEEKLESGPLEVLIDHAKDELELIPKMIEWEPWAVDPELPLDEDIPRIAKFSKRDTIAGESS